MATTTTTSKGPEVFDRWDLTIDTTSNTVQVRVHGARSLKAVIEMTADETDALALQLVRNAHIVRAAQR